MSDYWTVGTVPIARVEERRLPPETGDWLLPDLTPLLAQGGAPCSMHTDGSGALTSSTQTYALVSQGVRILIDTGIGNNKPRSNPAWDNLQTNFLQRLRQAGYPPETVDTVILTHLHADHVGWNTTWDGREWIPTFLQARYMMNGVERDYWNAADLEASRAAMIEDSIVPIEKLGMLDTPEVPAEGLTVTSEVTLLPTPGHTPGHVSVLISSQGEKALITGDLLHHPGQMRFPGTGSSADIDQGESARTRRKVLRWAADEEILILGSHFTSPAAGYVRREGDAYVFEAVNAAAHRS